MGNLNDGLNMYINDPHKNGLWSSTCDSIQIHNIIVDPYAITIGSSNAHYIWHQAITQLLMFYH